SIEASTLSSRWTSTRGGRGTPISSRSGVFTDAIVVPVASDARRACPAREINTAQIHRENTGSRGRRAVNRDERSAPFSRSSTRMAGPDGEGGTRTSPRRRPRVPTVNALPWYLVLRRRIAPVRATRPAGVMTGEPAVATLPARTLVTSSRNGTTDAAVGQAKVE